MGISWVMTIGGVGEKLLNGGEGLHDRPQEGGGNIQEVGDP